MKHKYGICCVLGVGPECLNDNAFGGSEAAKKFRSAIREQINKLVSDGYRVFVFDGAIGTSMWIHQAMNGIPKIRRVLVMPDKNWVPEVSDKDKGILGYFSGMVKHSDKVVVRKEVLWDYMVEHSDFVLAAFDSNRKSESDYLKTIRKAKKEFLLFDTSKIASML